MIGSVEESDAGIRCGSHQIKRRTTTAMVKTTTEGLTTEPELGDSNSGVTQLPLLHEQRWIGERRLASR